MRLLPLIGLLLRDDKGRSSKYQKVDMGEKGVIKSSPCPVKRE
jgi:hypothetical protein